MGALPPYTLTATRPRADLVDRLAGRLPKVGLDGVLADLDRAAERCPVPGEAAGDGCRWDETDRSDESWWPQGVTSTRWGGVLLVSWYARRNRLGRTPGSRLSVLDLSGPEGPRYRHVLLVSPRRRPGRGAMTTVPVHAGGIAVHGDVLHVADTLFGIRTFRLSDVLRVPAGERGARGYDYVLPQYSAFRVPLRAGVRRLRYSFLSVGEVAGRPSLVVGEYRRAAEGPARLTRYPIDAGTGLPATGDDGRCAPLEIHEGQPPRMQGVAVHGATWFVSASAGKGVPGDLYVGAPGAWQRHRGVLPAGPEDLAWARPGQELWCVSEWPGSRWVFRLATGPWRRPGASDASRRA